MAVNLKSTVASRSLSSVIRVTVLLWSMRMFVGLSEDFANLFASRDDSSNAFMVIVPPPLEPHSSP